MALSDALKRAQEKYHDKRKAYRLPTVFLTEEEFKDWEKALTLHGGSKKDAIVDCIRCYIEE